jgi:hypothetical protein
LGHMEMDEKIPTTWHLELYKRYKLGLL